MNAQEKPIRVLYSFPHKIGAARICYTAWEQVRGIAGAGAEVIVAPGVLHREIPGKLKVVPTLARGRFRIPYKLVGKIRASEMHDTIVARRLEKLVGEIDIIHAWPVGALRTIRAAKRLGIPIVLERANAHTRFAYEVVREECERIGVPLPKGHEHEYNEEILNIEEAEYEAADALLCPSDFVVKTFVDKGFSRRKLVRHIYGYDEKRFYPNPIKKAPTPGLTIVFVGVCAVRKGLHFALEAWLNSSASKNGTFLIAGEFIPAYEEKLRSMLSHPSIRVLGHREDIPKIMRESDVMILPSIEEGFGLVCTEAIGSGCVPLVSDACTELCVHMENALVHRAADVATLTEHINMLDQDHTLLDKLRDGALASAPAITWDQAGFRLVEAYQKVLGHLHSASHLVGT
jgi:glycosyltransferase involved in cell wall biosynthesis